MSNIITIIDTGTGLQITTQTSNSGTQTTFDLSYCDVQSSTSQDFLILDSIAADSPRDFPGTCSKITEITHFFTEITTVQQLSAKIESLCNAGGSISSGYDGDTVYVVGFEGQSLDTYDKSATIPAANAKTYQRTYNNLLQLEPFGNHSNQNSGGDWHDQLVSIQPATVQYDNALISRTGVQRGLEKYLDNVNGPKILILNSAVGGQPVSYFLPGGAGWDLWVSKVEEIKTYCRNHQLKFVYLGAQINQGQSDEARGASATTADEFADDHRTLRAAKIAYLGVTRLPVIYTQITHTTEAKRILREELNRALEDYCSESDDLSFHRYITEDEIASEDPFKIMQDDEHDSILGQERRGRATGRFLLERFVDDDSQTVNIDPPTLDPSLEAEVKVVGGVVTGSGDYTFTESATGITVTNDATEGDVITIAQSGCIFTNFTPVWEQGFSVAFRSKTPVSSLFMYLCNLEGIAFQFIKGSGYPGEHYLRAGVEQVSIGTVASAFNNFGYTLTPDADPSTGTLEVFLNGASVITATVPKKALGPLTIGGSEANTAKGMIGDNKITWFKNSPITAGEMTTKHASF